MTGGMRDRRGGVHDFIRRGGMHDRGACMTGGHA